MEDEEKLERLIGFVIKLNENNMTITVETYIGKVGGKEGVKLEQVYLVGDKHLELMSNHPLDNKI